MSDQTVDEGLPKLLTVEELSRYLNVSKGTIYYWTHLHRIPFIKIGKQLRFDALRVLESFAANATIPSGSCRGQGAQVDVGSSFRSLKTSGANPVVSSFNGGNGDGNHQTFPKK